MNPTTPHLVKITLVLTLLFTAGNVFSQIIYVSTAGDDGNTGDSWAQAYRTLFHAIDQADPGDDIWVAAGTYYPTFNSSDRDASFFLLNGVAIYGGFAGTETELSQRNIELNETILSGDINQSGDHDGNSYSVVDGSGVDQTAVLDGFTITMGNADGSVGGDGAPSRAGAGIFINDGSPTLNNLKVQQNWASNTNNNGGGMHVNGFFAEPVISNSLFSENDGFFGGAIYLFDFGQLTINNCTIVDNTGGGIYTNFNTYIEISNSLFEGNSGGSALTARQNSTAYINHSSFIGNAGGQVGAVFNWDSQIYVESSIFSGNTADDWGGAVYNSGPSVFEARNSLFFGNTAGNEGGAIYRVNTTTVKLINSVISGNSAGNLGGGISNPDNNGSIEIINSIVWNNRANNQTNTISASIFNINPDNTSISFSLLANSGGSGNWNSSIGVDLGDNIDLDPNFEEDVDLDNLPTSDGDLRLTACSPAIDAGNPDTTGLNLPLLDLDDNPRLFNATGSAEAIIDMGAYEFQSTLPDSDIFYVNAALPTSGNGTSWECAFTSLQDALAIAQAGDTIWVAAGTYYPTTDELDRNASFFLTNGVAIYGGFAGGETELSQRNIELNETILSGDINGTGDHDGNSYSVVNGSGVDQTAVLDGFTIKLGNADFPGPDTDLPDRSGAGIYISNGSPSLNQLIVEENITLGGGNRGGGIYVTGNSAHPIIENSIIRNNQGSEGGGINVRGDGNLTILNSDILENTGGGIFVQQNVSLFISGCLLEGNMDRALAVLQNSFAQIEHTSFIGNTGAFAGGAILNYSSEILVTDCIFSGNTASSTAGAIYNGEILSWGTPSFEARNSLFFGNVAASSVGGAFYNLDDAEVKLINCVLSGNSAGGQGGGMHNTDDSNVELINTIVWNNRSNGQTNTTDASIANTGNAVSNISFSLIANSGGSGNWNSNVGTDLGDNIDLDPNFEEDVDLDNLPTSDGDLRLTDCSPAIDAGNPDTTGLNLPLLDLDDNPRLFNATGSAEAIIDMGAYEFQSTLPDSDIIYVNAALPTSGNGTSWECAFTDLQAALAIAEEGNEIWVAAGTYYPTSDPLNRDAKFFLKQGVALYGGFTGDEQDRDERDWINNETILSGDINQTGLDDGNSYNVVDASCGSPENLDCPDENTILDGFTITMGYGDGMGNNRAGAGLLSIYGRPTVRNCTFWGNYAELGGGAIYNFEGEMLIQNCLFHDNYDELGSGSALFFSGSFAEIHNSTFFANTSNSNAGALFAEFGSSIEVINSIFWENGSTDFSFSGPDDPVVSYSLIQQQSGTYPGTGNLNVNPFFVDADLRNFKLSDCSPAIDAGNPDTTGLNLPELDLAGNPRVFNATGGPDRIDIGAYEFQSTISFSEVIYVNVNNPNPGTGISWDCALNDLQQALSVADSGAVIWVAEGTYLPTSGSDRTISFEMKEGVALYGGFEGNETDLSERDPENNVTVLSGDIGVQGDTSDNSYQVVTAGGGISNVILDGFTITLGNADGGGSNVQGAGMRVFGGASVTIENCKFVGNHADDRGAGMKVLSSTATIRNSIFQSNTAEIGAGLLANTNANVVVENSIFRNNEANVRGGGVFYNSSSGELRNCLFFNNTAGTEGGAVMMAVSASLEIINSTFANNFAADGGGLRIAGSFANIANSIFWGNGDEINGSVNSVSYSIIEGGFSGVGNFSADPLFSDPEGNVFTLQACSPAIDAGDNDALSVSDSLDLAGNPRLFDATELGSPTVDMGAYEFQAVVPAAGNPNVIYVDASNASSGSGRSWACAFTDLQNALAVAEEGDTIWVAQGSYSPTDDSDPEVSFELVSGVVMLGGFNGTETSADQRNWENNPTILDGDNGMGPNSNRVVYADNVDSTTVLDGFTIQGSQNFGSPTSLGGGMYISFGAPIIRNCTIQNNLAFEGGGGVYIESASPVFINTTFFGNSTSEGFYGGAVYAYFANPHFEECHFEQNFAFFGAGIYSEGSNISIKNTGFTQEFASISGGGILAEFGSQITIENATFSENEAGTGGAIAVEGSELIISGSNFTDNASFFGSGGAISSSEIFSISNIHIFSSTFSNNSSPENCGGAISLAGMGATLTIDSTDFIGNEAATGGAVCIEDSGQGTLSHVSFLENEGFFAGGAIYASDAGLLSINNGDFQENSSTEDGGSIFSSATLTFSIDSSEFILNAADSLGGAVFHAQDTLVLTNSYFYENTAHSGGAIYTSEGGLQVSFTDFESNIAAYRGGAHCALESKDDYEHVNFKKNEAAKGGAVFGDKTKSKFLHTKAKENKAQQKGGAYYKKDAEVEKKHSKIEENESESGGGIYSKKSEMYIDSSEFIKNMALEDGGGFKGDSSKTYFKNSKFEENEAKNGGGIKTDGCEAELDRTELKKNMASEKGGGMKNKGSKIDIKDSKIGQNEAGDDGGGIKGDSSKTDIKNSVFEKNKAKKGGAIATKGCDFNVKDTDIMDNEADEEGGGVYHENTKKLYDGVNVKNNKAEKDGGGMKIKHAQDSSKMKNVNVRDNSSQEKGGGMATDSSKIEFENCNFSKNKSEKGGNIYNNKSNCKYKNTKITAGKANKGGGMYNKKSSPEMINCQVTGNVALNQMNFQINQTAVRSMQGFLDGEGGGFFNEEGSPRLINLTLSGNFADDNGGGMYNTDSSNAEVSNTIVYNNQSGDGQDTLNSNVSNENSNPTFNNSVVEGANGSDDWNPEAGNDSGGNFDFDPQFVNELDPSSEPSEGGNFRLAGNSSAIDSGNDDDVPEDIETDIIGNARTSLFGVDIGAYERQSCQFDATNTIFVDANRTDSVGTGQSWETAFTELFDALFLALDCDSTFFIFIAEGTYYPTDDPTDREGAVFLRNSLNILGGFPGEGSPDLTDRDWREFHTTISGDINRSGDSEGNSYSVVAAFDADSSAVLDGVTIRDGNADGMNGSPLSPLRAGAGVYIIGSDPTLINLRIEENTAETGAGMLITGSASPSLYQIEILNNTALENGGGLADISFEGQDTVIWSNLLIAGNSAGENGGGLYLENQRNRIFLNTTVTQNMAEEEGSAVYNDNSLSHFRNSIFWENQGSIFNLGSALTADFSLIQLPVGVYPGIGNFNANPFFSDPDALDFSLTGCSPAINAGTSEFAPDVDLLGNIRPANSNVDMGAYEFQGTPEENCCPEGEIIYVNHQAQGVNNGSDWVNAFTDLQDALDLVCPEVTQIWIAEGTYYPTTDTMDRDSSFVIPSGISVYGGFQGDEESVEERNWYLNRTILSGDINESGTLDGNSHTVVVIEDAQSEVLLDGLFITKGNADGYLGMVVGPHNSGGGLYIDNSLVVGRNLYVEDNTSVHSGAGISIFESEVDLVNMVVTANYSEFQGGGLFLDGQSEVSLINATFSGNKSDNEGGAVYSQQGNLSIFNSIIWNNSADSDTESLSASISDLGTGLSISHSLISGSGGSGTHWNLPVASDGGGNLDVDPLFVGNVDFSAFPSASGDLNLTSCSPALDRGLNSAVQNLVSEDIGSDPRLFNSTDIDSAVVDMGAYEFQGEAEFPDLNCDDISVFLDEVGEKELTDDQLVPDAESCGTLGISWSGFDSLSFDCSNTGTYIVSMVGTDSASLRMDSCQFELTVSDTIDPVVTCSDATIDLDANGIATLEVGDFNYFASSNCAFDTLYVNNSEFSCSDVGTNIFEFVVTDINNNTTICSAEVEVINPFTPQVDCRDTSIVLVDTDMAIIEPGDIGEVIGSNCAIDSVWIDMNSLGCPEVGPNTVQFFAVDITGKKDSCSSEITIVDEIVTMAQCKNLTVYLDSLGNASIQPEEVDDHSILSCSIIDSQLDKSDFSCMDVGEFPVITLSFLDGDGTVGHCNSIVEVLDTIAPFVECEDVTIEIEPGDAFVILDPDTLVGSDSFDACGIATSAVDKDTFFLQDLGENTVELTVQDPSDNAVTCSAVVTVEGCPPFNLDCPAPDTIYVESGCAIVNLNYESATSNDSPCPLEFSQLPYWGQLLNPGVYTQLVSAEDPAGNTASCSFELTVKDTIPPTVSCPEDGVVYVNEDCNGFLDDYTGEVDANDNCGISQIVQMPSAGFSMTADDTTEVTITVFDQSDNSATCSFFIVAVDTISPTLQCDEDLIVRYVDGNCQEEVGDLTSLANPEDNCVTSFTTVQDIAADFVISAGDELTVTLSVSNENGWSGSCEIPVMAVDTLEPQLTCLIDSDTVQVDIDCNASLGDYTGYAFVSDNCLAPGYFAVSQSPAAGFNLSPGDEFSVNLVTSDNGQWEDSCQINIVVVHPFDPVLNCQTENIVREVGPQCLAEVGDLTSIATVSDNCLTGDAFTIVQNIPQDSMIGAGVSVNAVVNVSDTTGWSAQCSVAVSAINESVFSWQDPLPTDDTLSCALGAEIISLTLSDFCDTLSVYPSADTTMGCMGIETLVFTWIFEDLSHSQTIVFVDNTPPVWLTHPLPQDTTVECDQIPAPVTLEAEDLCSEVNIEFEEEVLGDTIAGSYTLSRSWSAADHCGNEIDHQQLLTVVDLTPPTIACPDTVVIDADEHCSVTMPDLRAQVTVDDNCSAIPNISINQIPSQGLTVIVEEITVFAVAIDEAGNSITCTFILKVENFGQDASIQCPEPVSVNAQEGDCYKFVEFEASFTQGCDGVVIVNDFNSGAEDASGVYPLGTTEVSFVLSQNGQPADSCVSSVEVLDVEVPELTCPDDIAVDTDPDACLATGILPGEAWASSTCGNVLVSVDIPTSLEIGLNTIVHTAEADNGQTAQCEQIVEVHDANPPSIDCPDDLTVQVDSGQCVASGVETGDATATSLCGEVEIESDAPEIFSVGTTIVTYTATSDNDLEANCEQQVTITWMDAVEINCPDDITKVLIGGDCELEDLDLGTPVLMPLCGDISIGNDAPGVFEAGITAVTHTATLPNGTELTCVQEVEVIDNYPISIVCPESLVFITEPGICEVVNPDVGEAEVFTVCQSATVESDVPAVLLPGTHTVTHTASTGSGIEVSCEQIVEVQDHEDPTIVCPDDKAVQIPLGSSNAQVDLSLATAHDNCGIDQISNNWNSGGADASGFYPSGETSVIFTALDVNGNSSSCVTLVSVQLVDTSLYSISGNVSSWNNVGMSDVELVLSSGLSESHFTDVDGDYQFAVPGSINLIISPEKDISWPTGISVVDLVMTQRHILQIETFDSPYRIIAADVNGSGSNSTIDLVIMQSIILGINNAEPNISPMIFIPADYQFSNPQNPFINNWPENLAFQSVSGNKADQDFVAIKRGDVSGTAFSGIRLAAANPLELTLDVKNHENEGHIEVVVSGSVEKSMRGYQMEFSFDPGSLNFEGVEVKGSKMPDMRDELFHFDQENGVIRAIWYNAESVDLSNEKQLFSLRFSKSNPSISVKDHFGLITSPQGLMTFATGPDHPKIPIVSDWRSSEGVSVPGIIDVSPNPFRDLAVVNFEMPENQSVNIRVFDAAGAVIYDTRFHAVEGLNRYDLKLDGEFSGALYLLLETSDWNQVINLMRIE